MPDDHSRSPQVLGYATPAQPGPLLELVSKHFVVGAAAGTIGALGFWMWRYRADGPITLSCGGIVVIVIQMLFVWLGVGMRRLVARGSLGEWHRAVTVAAGVAGSVLAYLPAVGMAKDPDLKPFLIIPLFVFPTIAGFTIVRRRREL